VATAMSTKVALANLSSQHELVHLAEREVLTSLFREFQLNNDFVVGPDDPPLKTIQFECTQLKYIYYRHDFGGIVANVFKCTFKLTAPEAKLEFSVQLCSDDAHDLQFKSATLNDKLLYYFSEKSDDYNDEEEEDSGDDNAIATEVNGAKNFDKAELTDTGRALRKFLQLAIDTVKLIGNEAYDISYRGL
jgi:hypothetical protein